MKLWPNCDTVTISSFYFKSKGQLDLKWFLISFLPGVKSLIISRWSKDDKGSSSTQNCPSMTIWMCRFQWKKSWSVSACREQNKIQIVDQVIKDFLDPEKIYVVDSVTHNSRLLHLQFFFSKALVRSMTVPPPLHATSSVHSVHGRIKDKLGFLCFCSQI